MSEPKPKTLHLIITGRVQGVGYRAWMAATARQLGITGWVRNRREGTVEAVISGEEKQLDDLLAACQDGPPAARVEHIDVATSTAPAPDAFMTLPTE
ncbi:acylphosphatase [bacterium]|nr:acylphosphatase [bacterium]